MNTNLHVVLMAGGAGTRFWPYSRNAKPKQFLDILNCGQTLLQSTLDRFLIICKPENIWVVANEEHADLVKAQLPSICDDQILLEPMRRNTAPCIAYAANKIFLKAPDAIMIVSPSDHVILNDAQFFDTMHEAVQQAQDQNKLITIGINPTRPDTGYGYIQFVENQKVLKKVKTFTEKPVLELAKTFFESGEFVWNSGIFVWNVTAILNAFVRYLPELSEFFDEIRPKLNSVEEKNALHRLYSHIKNISIDYAVMEQADNVYMIRGNFAWSDLGSWNSLFETLPHNEDDNLVSGEVLIADTKNSIIKGTTDKLLVVNGLDGYLVGIFDNVIIVCEKDKEDLFRRYVNIVKSKSDGVNYL